MSKQKILFILFSLFFSIASFLVISQKASAWKPAWCGVSSSAMEDMNLTSAQKACCAKEDACAPSECSKSEDCSRGKELCVAGYMNSYACQDGKCVAGETTKCRGECNASGTECDNQADYEAYGNSDDYSAVDAGSGSAYNLGNMDSPASSGSSSNGETSSSGSALSSSSGGSLGDLSGLAGTAGLPNPSGGIKGVVDRVLNWMLGIFGALALLAFVISGIMYLTAAGDTDQIKKAKTAMIWSIIGVVVGLGGVIVLQTIDYLLR